MRYLFVAAMVLGGCGGQKQTERIDIVGAVASNLDSAMRVVWDESYEMERASRPVIALVRSYCDSETSIGVTDGCTLGEVDYQGGAITIAWPGKPSESDISEQLSLYREWMLTGETKSDDGYVGLYAAIGQKALIASGL